MGPGFQARLAERSSATKSRDYDKDRMPLLLKSTLPKLADELVELLNGSGREDLAAQIDRLSIVDRCRCGDDFCATFYTQKKPEGSYGPGHENVVLDPDNGMIILDVVNGEIACIEVLYRQDLRNELLRTVP